MAKKTAVPICTPKSLPEDQLVKAAEIACNINPANAPAFAMVGGLVLQQEHIAALTTKWWRQGEVKLGVAFVDNAPADLRARILSHANAWGARANVKFLEASAGNAEVRIARQRNSGYWSYLGVDILSIPRNQQTMNLDSFTMNTSEKEFVRVVRHEFGHTLGFPHEHMRREIIARIDPEKCYRYFEQTQGWSRQMVMQQVLTPLEEQSLMTPTATDQTSIMCYQLPGTITRDGKPILGGNDINATDAAYAGTLYPMPEVPVPPTPPPTGEFVPVEMVLRDASGNPKRYTVTEK